MNLPIFTFEFLFSIFLQFGVIFKSIVKIEYPFMQAFNL